MRNFKISKDLLIGCNDATVRSTDYVIDKFCECLISSEIETKGMLLLGIFHKKDVKDYQELFFLKDKNFIKAKLRFTDDIFETVNMYEIILEESIYYEYQRNIADSKRIYFEKTY